jgi:hypothetical protein
MRRAIMFTCSLVATPHQSFATEASLFTCSARSFRAMTDAGDLGDQDADFWLDWYSAFIVDTQTGAVRFNSNKVTQWIVVKEGNSTASDTILSPSLPIDELDGYPVWSDFWVADTTADFLRIRTWRKDAPATFFLVALTHVLTGTCAPIALRKQRSEAKIVDRSGPLTRLMHLRLRNAIESIYHDG